MDPKGNPSVRLFLVERSRCSVVRIVVQLGILNAAESGGVKSSGRTSRRDVPTFERRVVAHA
jgi:hypothetical protein